MEAKSYRSCHLICRHTFSAAVLEWKVSKDHHMCCHLWFILFVKLYYPKITWPCSRSRTYWLVSLDRRWPLLCTYIDFGWRSGLIWAKRKACSWHLDSDNQWPICNFQFFQESACLSQDIPISKLKNELNHHLQFLTGILLILQHLWWPKAWMFCLGHRYKKHHSLPELEFERWFWLGSSYHDTTVSRSLHHTLLDCPIFWHTNFSISPHHVPEARGLASAPIF